MGTLDPTCWCIRPASGLTTSDIAAIGMMKRPAALVLAPNPTPVASTIWGISTNAPKCRCRASARRR
jgi:hypothetical protein